MTDADGFRIEAAIQFGATFDDDCTQYTMTEAQLIAFAKACERAGRAQAVATIVSEVWRGPDALGRVQRSLMEQNIVADAELAPLLEAERQRVLAESAT